MFFLLCLPAKGEELTVSLDLSNGCHLPTLQVRVGSKDAVFLLDTGASVTVVDNDLLGIPSSWVDKARLRLGQPGLQGVGAVTRVQRLQIGNYDMKSSELRVLDLKALDEKCGQNFGGILGIDLLQQFKQVRIDFKQKELRLLR